MYINRIFLTESCGFVTVPSGSSRSCGLLGDEPGGNFLFGLKANYTYK